MWEIREGDALERLREMGSGSVQCCVTSPPYFGLRDYGTGGWVGGEIEGCDHTRINPRQDHSHGEWRGTRGEQPGNGASPMGAVCTRCGAQRVDRQIGLEPTPAEFVAALVAVFREVWRVLRDDGTLWLNIGDSYNNRAVSRPSSHQEGLGFESDHLSTSWADHAANGRAHLSINNGDLKEKDLLMIPAQLALALRADGWYLRSEIVWAKPNPMPESVMDRPTSAHEKLFLLTKSPRYFYDADAIREGYAPGSVARIEAGFKDRYSEVASGGFRGAYGGPDGETVNPSGRNKRNVWEIATAPYAEAHFATFPPKLVEPCVLAGTSPKACGECGAPWRRVTEREYINPGNRTTNGSRSADRKNQEFGSAGFDQRLELRTQTIGWEPSCDHADDSGSCVVLDPFAGSGTTGVVARWHGRSFVGVELNPEYAALARRRIESDGVLRRAAKRPRARDLDQLDLLGGV